MTQRKGRRENENMPAILTDGTIIGYKFRAPLSSPAGLAWLQTATRFYFDAYPHTFTAQRQQRRNGQYWYAYRRAGDRLYSVYIGKEITLGKLWDTAKELTRKCGNRC